MDITIYLQRIDWRIWNKIFKKLEEMSITYEVKEAEFDYVIYNGQMMWIKYFMNKIIRWQTS